MPHISLNIRRFAASLCQTGCAGVAQIVKANVPQVMFLQELPELRTQTLRMERKSVACCHYRTGRPAWLTLTQKLFYLRMERKGTAARLGF